MLDYRNRYTIMVMAKSNTLAEQVAEKLADDLDGIWSHHIFLPGIPRMAPHYGVGVITMLNACRLLRKKGLLDFRRGRRMCRTGGRPEPPAKPLSGEQRIAAAIRNGLIEGSIRSGQSMPKIAFWTAKEKVSPHTVLRVYRRLEQENLIHKSSRQWKAGPKPLAGVDIAVTGIAYILLVQPRDQHWKGLMYSERVEKFCHSLHTESDQHNVGLLPVVAEFIETDECLSPSGEVAIHELIRQLEGRYLGSLIACSPIEMPDLEHWARRLAQWGKPVVWFDRSDEPHPLAFRHRHFTHCHFTETAAVQEVLSGLTRMGHRDICFLRLDRQGYWIDRRQSIFETAVEHLSPATSLHQEEPLPGSDTWAFDRQALAITGFSLQDRELRRIHDRLFKRLEQKPYARWKWLIRLSPYILPYLLKGKVTAFIVPNDEMAVQCFHWLKAAGLSIPGDLSLVSFDNYARVMHLPIATTDFGMASLGYKAFHLLLGDISIPRQEKGRIAAMPKLINRGSLGPPRVGPLRWSL